MMFLYLSMPQEEIEITINSLYLSAIKPGSKSPSEEISLTPSLPRANTFFLNEIASFTLDEIRASVIFTFSSKDKALTLICELGL